MPPSSGRRRSATSPCRTRSAIEQAARAGFLILLAVAAAPGGAAPAAAQEGGGLGVNPYLMMGEPAGAPLIGAALEASTEELASVMRCPVCQGLSVADSPTNSAIAMKREVREFLAAGYSPEQILDYFERSYGEFIRLEPKPTGFNWAVWLTPIAALLAGVALLVWRMRRQRSSPQQSAEDSELAAYLERVRQEVSG